MLCFSKFPVAKEFMTKRGGGTAVVSSFSIENFLTHMSKNFAGEPFCAVLQKKFSSARKLLIKRVGDYKDCPSIIFFLTLPKVFVEEPFCVSESFWYQNNFG